MLKRRLFAIALAGVAYISIGQYIRLKEYDEAWIFLLLTVLVNIMAVVILLRRR